MKTIPNERYHSEPDAGADRGIDAIGDLDRARESSCVFANPALEQAIEDFRAGAVPLLGRLNPRSAMAADDDAQGVNLEVPLATEFRSDPTVDSILAHPIRSVLAAAAAGAAAMGVMILVGRALAN